LFITNNVVENVNDNAITVVDSGHGTSRYIHIESNVILNPLNTGIFFGADGEQITDPAVTTTDVHVANNTIVGDWSGACINGMLPANAARIQVVNNQCTKTGSSGPFAVGILVSRVNGSHPFTRDVLVGFNTVAVGSGVRFDPAGILVKGNHQGVRVVGNSVRNTGERTILLSGTIREATVAENLVTGGAISLAGNVVGSVHDNQITDSLDSGLYVVGTGAAITASLKDNIIRRTTQQCVLFDGAGIYEVDLIGNTFTACGSTPPIGFINGAVLTPGSWRLQNKGDIGP